MRSILPTLIAEVEADGFGAGGRLWGGHRDVGGLNLREGVGVGGAGIHYPDGDRGYNLGVNEIHYVAGVAKRFVAVCKVGGETQAERLMGFGSKLEFKFLQTSLGNCYKLLHREIFEGVDI